MSAENNGVLQVPGQPSPEEGYVAMTPEVIAAEKEKQFNEQLGEIRDDVPNVIAEKMKELPTDEEAQIRHLVDNNLLPESALDKFKADKKEVSEIQSESKEIVSSDEEEDEIIGESSEDEIVDDEEWETSISDDSMEKSTESKTDEEEDPMADYQIVESTPEQTVFRKYVHDKPVLTRIENKKLTAMSDPEEFEKFLVEQRKKYREKVSIPLINSGVVVDFIGAGALDYSEIYSTDPEEATITDVLKRMKVMTKNIVDTQPKMSGKKLLSSIGYSDYQLASFGFAAATIPEIEIPSNCEHCDASFIVKSKTIDMLINADKIEDRWTEITNTPERDRVFKKVAVVEFFGGYIEITIETPNFEKVKTFFTKINEAVSSKKVDPAIKVMSSVIINIEKVVIDNVIVNDPINIYRTLKTMSEEEIDVVRDAIGKIYEDIIVPEFGTKVSCPKCNKENIIRIASVDEMVFYHLWARRMLSTLKSQKKSMKTGS